MGDFIDDYMGWIILAVVAVLVFFLIRAFQHDAAIERQFMAECMADGKKHYECQAMWRTGESNYVPIIIPMPMGR